MENNIKLSLPENYNFDDKKQFFDLCRSLLNPIGEYTLLINVNSNKLYKKIRNFFDQVEVKEYINNAFRITTPFGFIVINYKVSFLQTLINKFKK